jgi:redox-sensitive bicupin YhaK (pirin superfamily)
VIAGSIGGAHGPMDDIVIDPEYFDCTVPMPAKLFSHHTDPAYTAFIYVIGGKGRTDGKDQLKTEPWCCSTRASTWPSAQPVYP